MGGCSTADVLVGAQEDILNPVDGAALGTILGLAHSSKGWRTRCHSP